VLGILRCAKKLQEFINLEIYWRILKMLILQGQKIRICFGSSIAADPAAHLTTLPLTECRSY